MFYFLLKYEQIEEAHRQGAGFDGMLSKRDTILKSYSKQGQCNECQTPGVKFKEKTAINGENWMKLKNKKIPRANALKTGRKGKKQKKKNS